MLLNMTVKELPSLTLRQHCFRPMRNSLLLVNQLRYIYLQQSYNTMAYPSLVLSFFIIIKSIKVHLLITKFQ